jgi:hypothetical protein
LFLAKDPLQKIYLPSLRSKGYFIRNKVHIPAFQPAREAPQGARVKEFPCGERLPFPLPRTLGSEIVIVFIGHGFILLIVKTPEVEKSSTPLDKV